MYRHTRVPCTPGLSDEGHEQFVLWAEGRGIVHALQGRMMCCWKSCCHVKSAGERFIATGLSALLCIKCAQRLPHWFIQQNIEHCLPETWHIAVGLHSAGQSTVSSGIMKQGKTYCNVKRALDTHGPLRGEETCALHLVEEEGIRCSISPALLILNINVLPIHLHIAVSATAKSVQCPPMPSNHTTRMTFLY